MEMKQSGWEGLHWEVGIKNWIHFLAYVDLSETEGTADVSMASGITRCFGEAGRIEVSRLCSRTLGPNQILEAGSFVCLFPFLFQFQLQLQTLYLAWQLYTVILPKYSQQYSYLCHSLSLSHSLSISLPERPALQFVSFGLKITLSVHNTLCPSNLLLPRTDSLTVMGLVVSLCTCKQNDPLGSVRHGHVFLSLLQSILWKGSSLLWSEKCRAEVRRLLWRKYLSRLPTDGRWRVL